MTILGIPSGSMGSIRLDPPYWGCEDDYGKGAFSRDDFTRMADVLSGLQGRFILSVNDVPELRDLFSWAQIDAVALTYSVGGGDNVKQVSELIISN